MSEKLSITRAWTTTPLLVVTGRERYGRMACMLDRGVCSKDVRQISGCQHYTCCDISRVGWSRNTKALHDYTCFYVGLHDPGGQMSCQGVAESAAVRFSYSQADR
jgi:hypothetical protein